MPIILIIKCIREAHDDGLTEMEKFYWRKNKEKALMVRRVIDNFDSIKDVEGQEGSLSSTVLVEFLKWCGVAESLEKGLYEKHFRPSYMAKGKYKVLGWNTVSGRRKELKDLGDTDEKLAEDFEERLSELFPQEDDVAQEIRLTSKQ